jgi:hypothetical protein
MMTPGQKQIAIGVGITAVLGGGILVALMSKAKAEAEAKAKAEAEVKAKAEAEAKAKALQGPQSIYDVLNKAAELETDPRILHDLFDKVLAVAMVDRSFDPYFLKLQARLGVIDPLFRIASVESTFVPQGRITPLPSSSQSTPSSSQQQSRRVPILSRL